MKKIRMLLSARDPVTAYSFKVLLEDLLIDLRFETVVIAQSPAYEILSGINKNGTFVKVKDFDVNLEKLFTFTQDIVQQIQPEVVLTGISGPGLGIDEVLLAVVEKTEIRTFALQSYWGDLNEGIGSYAKTIFVFDEFAAQVTSERIKAECIVVGSLKHQRYGTLNIPEIRKNYRNIIGATNKQTVIGFFGQPLGDKRWYKNTILAFAKSCQNVVENVILIYRAHPKETVESRIWTVDTLHDKAESFINDQGQDIEATLAACDIVVSAFSTSAYDLQQLIYASDSPIAVPVYLFFDCELRAWYKEYSKLDVIPLTEDGMAISVQDVSDLDKCLIDAVKKETQTLCFNGIHAHFSNSVESSKMILDYIYNSK